MRWLKISGLLIALAITASTIWLLWPENPIAASTITSGLEGVSPSDRLASEANRIARESNAIAYQQGIVARVGAFTGLITLIAAIAAAFFARLAAIETRRNADIAKEALIAGERAWISVNVVPEGPLRIDLMGGLEIAVGVHIKNVGRSPALNVHTDVAEISADFDLSPARLVTFAAAKRVANTDASRLLLPDQSYVRSWVPGSEPLKSESSLFPMIFGAVTYQLALDQSLHQTSFAVLVTPKDDRVSLAFEGRTEIPLDEIQLLPWSGASAD